MNRTRFLRLGLRALLGLALLGLAGGCVLTKVVSVPLRLTGAVISVIPVAGNQIDDAIDSAADSVDDIPI